MVTHDGVRRTELGHLPPLAAAGEGAIHEHYSLALLVERLGHEDFPVASRDGGSVSLGVYEPRDQ